MAEITFEQIKENIPVELKEVAERYGPVLWEIPRAELCSVVALRWLGRVPQATKKMLRNLKMKNLLPEGDEVVEGLRIVNTNHPVGKPMQEQLIEEMLLLGWHILFAKAGFYPIKSE